MLKNTALFLSGFATMAAIGVIGSLVMARKDPQSYEAVTDWYKGK